MLEEIKKNQFLFEELVKRDFKQKYKRTVLGMVWSILSPLLTLLVMRIIFTQFFGRNTPHYTIYLFSGTLIMSYFRESTRGGMGALLANAHIFSKINIPKYIFVLSKNVSALVNFLIILLVYFFYCGLDRINFGVHMFSLIFPVICLLVFNVGVGMILSAMFIFFRDTQYIYDIFLTLLQYVSAIFYTVDSFAIQLQRLFLLNPVYCYIKYFRCVVIDGMIPSVAFHRLCSFYAIASIALGIYVYRKYNHKFLYYI